MLSLKQRWLIVLVVMVLGVVTLIPNFIAVSEDDKDHWFYKNRLTYGLDIQGGLHLVLGVDLEGALDTRLLKYLGAFKDKMKDKIEKSEVRPDYRVYLKFKKAPQIAEFETYLEENHPQMFFMETLSELEVQVFFSENWKSRLKEQVVSQAVEVIRNRVDEFGVSEPVILPQGSDRIVVQLPGVKNATSAKALIQKAAVLEFRPLHKGAESLDLEALVSELEKKEGFTFSSQPYSEYVSKINKGLASKLPKNSKVVFEQLPSVPDLASGRRAMLIDLTEEVSGDLLEDAQVGFDEYGSPRVIFRFSPQGRKGFAELTGNHIGEPVAIILDQVVKSAPRVQDKIDSNTAEITLGNSSNYDETFKEAQLIATALRAGSLPAALVELQERTVGPSLGQKALESGKLAGLVGAILLALFLLAYYRGLGMVVNITLILNLTLLLALLSGFQATITLPSIVGLLLTVGMAVDANVIIYERIREELDKKFSMVQAVQEGFAKAFSSIFDANLTTIMVCLILMYLGSGSVRGFAVTLALGVVISMFTSIFVSKTIILSILKWKPNWRG